MSDLKSTAELLDRGLSSHEIRRRVLDGRLERVHPGYFMDARRYRELSPEQRVLAKQRAFARAAHVTPVFCLASAAVVHGLGLRRVPSRIHTVSPPERGTHHGYTSVVRHEAVLPASDIEAVEGLRVTTAERTLLDCARLLPFTDAVVLADQAHCVGVSRSRLEARLPQWAGQRGVRRARSVLAAMDPRAESVGETLTRLLLAESSLPMPRLQWVIEGRSGSYRADFAWPEHRLVLEFDGETKYAGAATLRTVLRDERRREVEIQELGWRVIRVGWNDVVHRPAATLARIDAALLRASSTS
ncbi:DUF559 domain-containing protein [Kocuria sp. CH-021]|uniref:DUF559 domain-containing protein n=1 Tax=Kocuria sp. CH-021 TaxID=3406735 RepID=UPI003C71E62B